MKKRIISLILAAVLCIGLLPATALADAAQNASAPAAQAEQNEPAAPTEGGNGADPVAPAEGGSDENPAAPQSTEGEASEQEGEGETVENPEAEINGKLYERLFDALDEVKTGDTIKLLNNIDHYYENIVIKGGPYTLDLNGYKIDATVSVIVGNEAVSGSLTVVDSSEGTGRIERISFRNGSLTIGSGTIGHFSTWYNGSGSINITGGTVESFDASAKDVKVQISGGMFKHIDYSVYDDNGDYVGIGVLLADGYALAYSGTDEIVNCYKENIASGGDRKLSVVPHEHDMSTGSGLTAGKCACGADFEARVTARVGGASDVSYYDTIDSAFTAAHEGDTVTLLADITSRDGSIFVSGGPYTLDLNGHRIDASGRDLVVGDMDVSEALLRGELTVKDSSTDSAGYVQYLKLWNGDLTVESGNFHQIIETGPGSVGTITITGGTVEDVTHTSPNVTFQLSGGTFESISISSTCGENVFPSDLLADGYAYADKNSGAIQNGYAEGFSSVSDVKVVKHDHTWNDGTCACGYTCSHTAVDENGNCTVCKKPMAAMVTKGGESRAYAALNDALSAAADGGTVKLLANAGEITINSPLKLDLNGKTAAKLTVTGDITLASLLPEGCAFKSGTTWITDPIGTELTNVSMAKIPIKSMDYPTEMSMTYGGTGTLLVTVKKETGTGAVRFQWYKVEDGKETAVGSATTKNQFDLAAQKLPAGNHTFRFSATCDGYKKMSQDIAVTVGKASISANRITPPTAQENLTYTGQEQALITAGSVTSGGTMQYSLTENGTYSQDTPTGTDAGAYTVWYRVIGDENHNDTTPASVAVRIGTKPLTITGVTAASKPYDGTTDADISSVTFDNVTLNRGTDYTVTASFDDASVGSGKNVTATVTLMGQAAKNYALEQSSFMTTASITKAAAPDFTKETALVIVNGHEKTYTVTLPALPKLETPKEYGALTYEIGGITLDGSYYTGGAKVENGELTLPVEKNDVDTTGPIGTVTVKVTTTNYEDITLTVNVSAENKIVPTGQPTLQPDTITYGDTLGMISLSGTLHDDVNNVDVEGTFSWVNPETTPDAGTYAAEWRFTPKDGETYLETSGQATITVNRATPAGEPKYTRITSGGRTLADAKLTANDSWPAGTVEWVDADGNVLPDETAVKANTPYTWRFTPSDTRNYETITGKVTLYTVSNSGGSNTPVYPVRTPDKTENGTISTDPKSAEKGETVTITVKPDTGYELGDLIVTDKNGDRVNVINHGNGKFSFTMPEGGVTIRASFVEETENSPFRDVPKNAYYYKAVAWAAKNDITGGIGNGLFGPELGCTRAQFVTFLWRACGSPAPKALSRFTDVPADAYYAKAVAWAVENGITDGTSPTTFSPNQTCMRAHAVTFLWRALGKPSGSSAAFTDVPSGAYYAKAVAWAAENDVTTGVGGGRFAPDDTCTRAQIVTFLYRCMR